MRFNCQSVLGANLTAQERYAEAEAPLITGYEGMQQREGSIPEDDKFLLTRAGRWIVQLYEHWGKPDKAAEGRAKLHSTNAASPTP
jgi:eukaryotic-like serine/threonine-protein kinase